ncbi:hypothetical protein BBK82_31240 [Lentzea guizhouensis]|uniref:Uncharacterized protein n=1 Tax=Lentzea guizhouensis TaxID=1586287 RepID=A0A1B2HQ68_9PSEU|nr:hypothetical protein [Lentzea guizhouensis]ANZ39857.1 hypothetical protein BBK82_31240 [Lentzea guizhouensis]
MRLNFSRRLELAEDADPGRFPTEGARRRAIGFDRWAGRHPVLITLLFGAGLSVLLWLALPDVDDDRFVFRLVGYLVAVVGAMVMAARMALKARKKYYRR